jgi:hypothetical protein
MTSRITPSFVYDTRNGTIDPTRGRQVAASLAFAGILGDVRTIQPTLSVIQFIPVRRKRSANPEVFGFRIVAGHVRSYGITSKIRDAQRARSPSSTASPSTSASSSATSSRYAATTSAPSAPSSNSTPSSHRRRSLCRRRRSATLVPVEGISDSLRPAATDARHLHGRRRARTRCW